VHVAIVGLWDRLSVTVSVGVVWAGKERKYFGDLCFHDLGNRCFPTTEEIIISLFSINCLTCKISCSGERNKGRSDIAPYT
jgi:hypothetical protein